MKKENPRSSPQGEVMASNDNLNFSISDNFYIMIKATGLIATIVFIYFELLSKIFQQGLVFSPGNVSNYVLIVPVLIGYVLYRKKNILKAVACLTNRNKNTLLFEESLGIILCLLALLLFAYTSIVTEASQLMILSLVLMTAGGIILLFNLKTLRHAIFAIILLLYLQPPPPELVSNLAGDLSWIAAVMVENILKVLHIPVVLEVSVGAPGIYVENPNGMKIPFFIGEPSSGIYSMVGMSLQALFVTYLTRGKIWKRALLFINALPIFLLLNVFRITFIILLAYSFGRDVSEAFHMVGGLVMVSIGTIILLILAEKIFGLSIHTAKTNKECSVCETYATRKEWFCLFCGRFFGKISTKITNRNLVRIFLFALIITVMIPFGTKAEATSSKITELDIASLVGPETAEYLLPDVEGWTLDFGFRDSRIESILSQDAALVYYYAPLPQNETHSYPANFFIYTNIQISTGKHTWEQSLLLAPSKVGRPTAKVVELKQIEISNAPLATLFMYKRPNADSTEAVLYWFERVPLRFGNELQERNIQIAFWIYTDYLARLGFIQSPGDVKGTEETLMQIAAPVASFWKEIRASQPEPSPTDAMIAGFSGNFAAALLSSVSIISANHFLKSRHTKNSNKRILARLIVDEERTLVDSSVEALRNGKPTGESILKIYERKSNGVELDENYVVRTLSNASKSNLLETDVISYNDEPVLVWIPCFESRRVMQLKSRIDWLTRYLGY